MEVRVFEYIGGEFIQRLVTENAPTVKYKIHAYDVSDFSIEFPLDEFGANEFKKFRFVLIEKFIGIILSVKRKSAANGNMMSISGKDMKIFLENTIVLPVEFSGIEGTAGFAVAQGWTDSCIKKFWRENFGELAEISRRRPFLTIPDDKHIGISDDKYMSRFQKLSDVTSELAKNAKLVITSTPLILEGKILLDVVESEDRTASSYKPLIFSLENQTVLEMEYLEDINPYKNAFYATRSGAQFADEALTVLYTRDEEPDPTGIFRREQHLNVSVNTPTAGDEYNEMRRQANHDMQNYEEVISMTAKINFTKLKMDVDYNVGDFVTLQRTDWDVEADIQITAVEVSANESGRTEIATLGTGEKGYIRQIQTEINNI